MTPCRLPYQPLVYQGSGHQSLSLGEDHQQLTEQEYHLRNEAPLLADIKRFLQGVIVTTAQKRQQLQPVKLCIQLHLEGMELLTCVRVFLEQQVKVLQGERNTNT